MILLDTHIWVWWIQQDPHLNETASDYIDRQPQDEVGVSVISCWEVATLCSLGRLSFSVSLEEWMSAALDTSGVRLLDLTPSIAIDSVQLPGDFHRDPADRILVATSRWFDCPLITADEKILRYQHVQSQNPRRLG